MINICNKLRFKTKFKSNQIKSKKKKISTTNNNTTTTTTTNIIVMFWFFFVSTYSNVFITHTHTKFDSISIFFFLLGMMIINLGQTKRISWSSIYIESKSIIINIQYLKMLTKTIQMAPNNVLLRLQRSIYCGGGDDDNKEKNMIRYMTHDGVLFFVVVVVSLNNILWCRWQKPIESNRQKKGQGSVINEMKAKRKKNQDSNKVIEILT